MKLFIQLFLMATFACCSFLSGNAQTVYYKMTFKTSSSSDAGCDNGIDIQLFGTNGQNSSRIALTITAEHLNGQEEVQTIANKDLGSINKIMLDIDGVLFDDWKPEYIKIERATDAQGSDVDGSSFFEINKFIGYDPIYFNANAITKPTVSISEEGEPEIVMSSATVVNWVDNSKGTSPQLGVKVKEIQTKVKKVGIHVQKGTNVGISATVSYESPQTVAGTFGAELSASYNKMVSTAETTQTENLQTVENDWAYDIPPQSFAFRAIEFDIPYNYQKIKAGDVHAVLRTIGQPPIRTGESFHNIPNKDPFTGIIYPLLWQEIEDKYLAYLTPEKALSITNEFKDYWIDQGWVVTDPAKLGPTTSPPNQAAVVGSTKESRPNKFIQKIKNRKNGIVICLPPPTTLTAEGLPYKYSIKRKDDNTLEIYAEPIKAGEKPVANGHTIELDSKKE